MASCSNSRGSSSSSGKQPDSALCDIDVLLSRPSLCLRQRRERGRERERESEGEEAERTGEPLCECVCRDHSEQTTSLSMNADGQEPPRPSILLPSASGGTSAAI